MRADSTRQARRYVRGRCDNVVRRNVRRLGGIEVLEYTSRTNARDRDELASLVCALATSGRRVKYFISEGRQRRTVRDIKVVDRERVCGRQGQREVEVTR
jgi:hypothetical protein